MKPIFRLLLASAAVTVVMPKPAVAQDQQPSQQDAASSDDIVVIGEKSNRRVQDTPTSVAITTPDRILQENILQIQDIYDRTANVAQTWGASGFSIRGISNRGIGAGGAADTTTVYVDGAPIPAQALFGGPTDLWNAAQVEILRGPQSTIQGLNALAGAIILTTRDASTTQTSADARILWTDHAARTLSAAAGRPLIRDELGLRLSAEQRADRGIVRNLTIGDYADALRSLNLRAKLHWTPAALPGLDVQATANRVRRDGGYMFQYVDIDQANYFVDRHVRGDRPDRGYVSSDIAGLTIGYPIGSGLRLSSTTSFNRTTAIIVADGDGTPVDRLAFMNDNSFRTWTEELRLNIDAPRLSGVLGAWAYSRAGGLVADSRVAVPTPVGTIAGLLRGGGFPATAASQLATAYARALPWIQVHYSADQPERVRNAALFGDLRLRVTDRLSLLAGLRYDHEENRYGAQTDTAFTGQLPDPAAFARPGTPVYAAVGAINRGVLGIVADAAAAPASRARRFDAFLPKVGVSMAWSPDLSTAFTVQRAYRSGGSAQNPARATLVPYEPEYSWNYEASLRSRWWGGRLSLNANAFYIDWRQQQVVAYFGRTAYDYNTVNAGASHLYGGELEVQARIDRHLDAYGTAGTVRTRYDSFTLPTGSTSQVELAGSQFPYAARLTLAGGIDGHAGRWHANLNGNYRGPVFTDVGIEQGRSRVPGRTVVNARLGYDTGRWTAFAFAQNLLDARYIQYRAYGVQRAFLGNPQTFGAGWELHL